MFLHLWSVLPALKIVPSVQLLTTVLDAMSDIILILLSPPINASSVRLWAPPASPAIKLIATHAQQDIILTQERAHLALVQYHSVVFALLSMFVFSVRMVTIWLQLLLASVAALFSVVLPAKTQQRVFNVQVVTTLLWELVVLVLAIVQPVHLLLSAVYVLLLTICHQLPAHLAKIFFRVASTVLIVLFVWVAKEVTVLFQGLASLVQRVSQHVPYAM